MTFLPRALEHGEHLAVLPGAQRPEQRIPLGDHRVGRGRDHEPHGTVGQVRDPARVAQEDADSSGPSRRHRVGEPGER